MQFAHRNTFINHPPQRSRVVKSVPRRTPDNADAKLSATACHRVHGAIHFAPAMMPHCHYLPPVRFGMTQRRFNLFSWMPSSFHRNAPYPEHLRLSTDNLTAFFCLLSSMPYVALFREFHEKSWKSRRKKFYAGGRRAPYTSLKPKEKSMFKPDDFVQSKTGGPKMLVLRVEDETLWCARVDDATKKEIEVKADSVNLYHEDGDFGVC